MVENGKFLSLHYVVVEIHLKENKNKRDIISPHCVTI